jgi:serine/threonine-protein kinase
MSLQPGQIILNGKYRVIKLLGEGGMARVWLAEEPEFGGRQVAIKELRREALKPTELEDQESRFRQEVEIAAQLEQPVLWPGTGARVPHVIRAITLERAADDARLLVMEYAQGGSLAERIAQYPEGMPLDRAVQITLDLCQALQAFHSLPAMPVHRDIKPSNILFDGEGRAYLADFGLCQLPGRSGRTQLHGEPHPATPLYAAPEQLRSPEPLTPAADIFALGCVLLVPDRVFEMVTGKPYKRVRPGTAASSLRPEVPGWLDAMLAQALAEDPWDRWPGAAAMAEAVRTGQARPLPAQQPVSARPTPEWGGFWRRLLGLPQPAATAGPAASAAQRRVSAEAAQPPQSPPQATRPVPVQISHPPFKFRGGKEAKDLDGLVRLCAANPVDAIWHLEGGHFEPWLAAIGQKDLAQRSHVPSPASGKLRLDDYPGRRVPDGQRPDQGSSGTRGGTAATPSVCGRVSDRPRAGDGGAV